MGNLFKLDGKLYQFLTKVIDLLLLNLLFILTSLPIITIGVSWSALLAVSIQKEMKNEQSVIKLYFKSFKDNLKAAFFLEFILMIFLLLIIVLSYVSIEVTLFQIPSLFIITPLLLLSTLLISTGFPYIARYRDSLLNIITNSLGIFIIAPFQIIKIMILNGSVLLLFFLSFQGMVTIIYIFTFIGFSILSNLNVKILLNVFNKIEE